MRKIVIPVAGLGTRLLPATKAVPKDLLPIGRKPLVQFAVEEAAASGATTVVLVTRPGESLLSRYFSRDAELERHLFERNRGHEAESLRRISELVEITCVTQDSPAGLADAIRCAHSVVGNEPFGVILPDALIISHLPCIGQLIECYRRNPGIVIATHRVAPQETDKYGILIVADTSDGESTGSTVRVISTVEKPNPSVAPSLYGIFGRYVLEATIFEAIEAIRPDASGELQLTEALNLCCKRSPPVYGHFFQGDHYDTGSALGAAQATVACTLADPQVGPAFREYLESVTTSSSP